MTDISMIYGYQPIIILSWIFCVVEVLRSAFLGLFQNLLLNYKFVDKYSFDIL